MRTRIVFILFELLFVFFTHFCFSQDLLVISDDKKIISLATHISIYEDKSNQFTITDILQKDIQNQFAKFNNPVISFGFSSSSYWLKTTFLYNGSSTLALQINSVLLDSIQVYLVEHNQVIAHKQAGLLMPFHTRDVNTNNYIFDLSIAQKSTCDMYIRVNSISPIEVFASLGDKELFMEQNSDKKFVQGIYFGFVLLMILYNLFIYITVKDLGYLLYVFSCFCVGLSNLAVHGFLFQYIFPNYFYLNHYFNANNVVCLAVIANIIFAIQFLRAKRYFKFSYYVAFGFICFFLFMIILNLLDYPVIAFVSSQFGFMMIAVIAIVFPYSIYKKGFKPARFFLFAWIGIIIGGVIDVLKSNQFLPTNDFTNYAYQAGTALEMLLLSFALANKINIYKDERIKAKEENLVLMEKNLKLAEENVYLVKEQNVILEEKVRIRTTELQSANREILEQNEELHAQEREMMVINQELLHQKELIENQNQELKATSYRLNTSIRYAQHIQNIILPTSERLNAFFQENFIVFLPKDIVSGDFYWFIELGWDKQWKKENQTLLQSINPQFSTYKGILAMIDCTGHGVPGAFMTMIVHTLLHEIIEIKKISNPAFILQNLHSGIKNLLKQSDSKNMDGMDMSICYFEKDDTKNEYQVTFAGAKGIAFYLKEKEIVQLSGERYSIGGSLGKERRFSNQVVTLPKDTMLYLSSDGYIDQNNAAREKFGSNNLKLLLSEIYHLPIHTQHEIVLKTLQQHSEGQEQRDDISVVGIKL